MTTHPVEALYRSRCTVTGDKLVPHFWQAQEMKGQDLTLLADDRKPIQDDGESLRCIKRLNALGLHLEIEVGSFINQATRKELPNAPYLKELLKSNVADEARHYAGFKFASEAYGSADEADALALTAKWEAMADKYHPVLAAATLEASVFLVTLGIMRLVGGSELSDLAFRISEDESRHVSINRTLARKLKLSPDKLPKDMQELVDTTLEYAVGDLNVPLLGGLSFDFFKSQSDELTKQGTASMLDQLTAARQHVMPFEVPNSKLYSRVTETGETSY